jgi:hypothetical protein
MPTRRQVLKIFASIGIVAFTIAGLARFGGEVVNFYHLAWPWLDPVRSIGLGVGVIGGWGVIFATPDRPPQWRWWRWSWTAREMTPLAIYLGVLAAGLIWTMIAPSGPSVLVWSLAKDSDLWWVFLVWQFWHDADQRQEFIDRNQAEPSQLRHGVC